MAVLKRKQSLAKPFLKWAGGKGQLLSDIETHLPVEVQEGKINTYVEPFLGGGAAFFFIAQKYEFITRFFLLDINEDLIKCYQVVKNDVESLIAELSNLQDEFLALDQELRKKFYLQIRESFNAEKSYRFGPTTAAMLLFLNRTCFNGLYRVNRRGLFNVPFGDYKRPTICDSSNLRAVSGLLKRAELLCGDFEEIETKVDNHTFVYIDPPYRPLSSTSSFTSYATDDFSEKDQLRLVKFCKRLEAKGSKFLLSNSDPKNEDPSDNFFQKHYKRFRIDRVKAIRAINSKGSGRGKISELMIANYSLDSIHDMGKVMDYRDFYKTRINCNSREQVFSHLIDTMKDTITGWDYFVNWAKVFDNIHNIEIDLNTLNYLIGKEDIETAFTELLEEKPSIARLVPIFIACRQKDFKILTSYKGQAFQYDTYDFEDISKANIPRFVKFAKEVGFLDLMRKKRIKSIVDYVIGIEVGLDSNGRKNRGGKAMEQIVEFFLKDICDRRKFRYLTQATAKRIFKEWGINISVDKTTRRIDFAVNTGKQLFLLEANFYGGGGSKLKSTAGEYQTLSNFWKKDGHEFIWITDGYGWHSTRSPLREAFARIDYILNLHMISKGILEDILLIG